MIVEKAKVKRYKFKLGDNIQVKQSKSVGIILERFRNCWGHTIYLCGIGLNKWTILLYEYELSKSELQVNSEIQIEEIESNFLSGGTWTLRTYPRVYKPQLSHRNLTYATG